jgi:hypothetical protein
MHDDSLLHLIFQDLQPRSINEFSPWLEFRPPQIPKLPNN